MCAYHYREMAHLDVDLVSAKHDGDVLANALEVTMPVGHVFVGDAGGHVEHDDSALSLNVVSITETTKLFLSSSVPDVEANGTEVGGELERVDLNTESGCVLVENVMMSIPFMGAFKSHKRDDGRGLYGS